MNHKIAKRKGRPAQAIRKTRKDRKSPGQRQGKEDQYYTIRMVVDKRTDEEGRDWYKTLWDGYPDEEFTWLPIQNFEHAMSAIQDYQRGHRNRVVQIQISDSSSERATLKDSLPFRCTMVSGSFARGHLPLSILNITKEKKFIVDWKDKDGQKIYPSVVSADILLEKEPAMLAEFLDQHIELVPRPNE